MFNLRNRVSHDGSVALNRKIRILYLLLIVANFVVWIWALIALRHEAALIGTALLAYSFGLRHALDADHIAAIDNVTRKLMQEGKRPVTVGVFFALGHSMVVLVATIVIAFSAKALGAYVMEFREFGSIVGTSVSASFLLIIGAVNLVLFFKIYRAFQRIRSGACDPGEAIRLGSTRGNVLARMFRPLFGQITSSWHMLPLGFLFGLGFETATEIALLATSSFQASQGLSLWTILIFPCLFTVGMLTVDAMDGVLMLGVYGWAFVKPVRKLYYNMTVTLISTLVAFLIGSIQAIGVIVKQFHLEGFFWTFISMINNSFGTFGYMIVGIFALSWIGSGMVYRIKRYDTVETLA